MDDIELNYTPNTKPIPTKLLELLKEKNFTQFAQLLDNKDDPFDVNHFYDDPYFGTLLDISCRSSGNHEFVKKLLEHGAEINRVNEKTGLAPIHEAVQNSDVDTVNVLLADEKCNAHMLDNKFYTPLWRAALADRRDILSTLLKNEKVTLVQWTEEDVFRIVDLFGSKSNEIESRSTDEENDPQPPNVVCNLEYNVYGSSDDSESEEGSSMTSSDDDTPDPDVSSPQIDLLYSLKNQEYHKFRDIFAQFEDTVDVNHFYDHPENGTLLDIACRTTNNSKFIEFLKEKKADINIQNPTRHGRTPLHTAVEYADEETLKILFGYENCNVNITDDYGNTPLHIAAKRDKPAAAKILLEQEGIQINEPNYKHESALYLALKRNHLGIIRQLQNRSEIELETGHNPKDISCSQIITKRYSRWGRESLKNKQNPQIAKLFSLLYENRTGPFIEQADSNETILSTADDGFYTYLQYACERGFTNVVYKLLELDVDPNQTCPNNTSTPIMISATKGYHKIVARLLKSPKISLDKTNDDKETVLHTLVRGLLAFQGTDQQKDPERDYHKCLKYILPQIPELVNRPDRDGNIALYCAAKSNDRKIVLLLLKAGSYVCHKNHNKDVVLQSIDPEILEKYLDGCISTNDESSQQSDYQITLNCEIFKQPVGHPESPEVAPLLVLNEVPNSRKFLQHPVLTSFLDLKWHILKKFYYINVLLYTVFVVLLSAYVLLSICLCHFSREYGPIRGIIILFGVIFILKELVRFYLSPGKYASSLFENLLAIGSPVASIFLSIYYEDPTTAYQLAAIAIFTSYYKLFFMIGKHPEFSTNTEIFKTVSWNFIKFLGCYCCMILAFTFSFYTLCKYNTMNENRNDTATRSKANSADCKNSMSEDQKDEKYPLAYHTLETSVIRSFMMMTGDFDAGCIPNSNNFDFSHILFFLFVLLVTIVLQNLLNGMAVDDIKKIRKNAQLLAIVSQIRFTWYIENATSVFDFFCTIAGLNRWGRRYPKTTERQSKNYSVIHKMTRLFPHTLPDCKIRILTNENNAVMFAEAPDSHYLKYSDWKIDIDIVESAVRVLKNKKDEENKKSNAGENPKLV